LKRSVGAQRLQVICRTNTRDSSADDDHIKVDFFSTTLVKQTASYCM
jgi:hypothetical protein